MSRTQHTREMCHQTDKTQTRSRNSESRLLSQSVWQDVNYVVNIGRFWSIPSIRCSTRPYKLSDGVLPSSLTQMMLLQSLKLKFQTCPDG